MSVITGNFGGIEVSEKDRVDATDALDAFIAYLDGADAEVAIVAFVPEVGQVVVGSNLLSTIAPGTPKPLLYRLSSVMLFSRSEASGIPQKSVIPACSSTTLASFSAASPVMSLKPTLCVTGAGDVREVHDGLPQSVCFLVNGR